MRFVWGVLGFMFLLLGTMFTVISFFLFFRHGHVMLLAGAITSIIPMGVGVIVLTIGAYNVTCDDKQITLAFVFRTESVPWELVKCYQKLFIGWSLRGKGPEIDAGVLILLKYLRAKSGGLTPASAVFWIRGTGPAFSLSRREFTTALDRFIPHKNRETS